MDGNEAGEATGAIGPHRHHNFVPWQIHRQVLFVTTLAALILTLAFLFISKPSKIPFESKSIQFLFDFFQVCSVLKPGVFGFSNSF